MSLSKTMALNINNTAGGDKVASVDDNEEIEVIEKIVVDQGTTNGEKLHSAGHDECENFVKMTFPRQDTVIKNDPTLPGKCRQFIKGGHKRGKTLLGRGRRMTKKFGGNFISSRYRRYLVGDNSETSTGVPTCMRQSMQHRERVRRSRLAEDALFYEDTFESSGIHGHVKEDTPKNFLQMLHKKSKSKPRSKRHSSTSSHSPVVENCICLKYLNQQKNIFSEKGSQSSISNSSKENKQCNFGAKPKIKCTLPSSKVLGDSEGQSILFDSSTDSLRNEGAHFRPSSVDMGMLLSLSLTDPIVTTFNNNGMPEFKQRSDNDHIHVTLRRKSNRNSNEVELEQVTSPEDLVPSCQHANTPTTHTQIDFTNFLIPGQKEIIQCPFYWGKIDRYQAEALLTDKPEGSFLLRDSAQEDFVFSVSFRRYSRSLHARIEEDGHMFSFDSHDPGVHASNSVRGLLEHYKDPLSCMFFEPMLLFPVVRKTCFSLQSLARASICDKTTFGGVSQLPLPKVLKQYLREYNYKHKIRIRYIDTIHDLSHG